MKYTQLDTAGSISGDEVLALSKLSSTIFITASTLSAQASDNSFNDSGSGFISAGFSAGDQVKIAGFTGETANNIFSATITALTPGKMTIGGADGNVIADDSAGESVTITKWQTGRITTQDIANLGSGSGSGQGYAHYLAASLEPDAIEVVQKDSFSYAVGSSVTKLLIASWQTKLGSTGRMEQRNPRTFFSMRDATLAGITTGSTAIIIDPAAVTYADAWDTYYSRLEYLCETGVKNLAFTSSNQKLPFLPGAYGAIITQYTCFDYAWLALRPLGGTSIGINLGNEISDADVQRVGDSLSMPIHKKCAGEVHSSTAGEDNSPVTRGGSISYVLLPSTWSEIADPNTYTFRDDFMGASIDTGVWTRVQSTAGNVEINTLYQWCKVFGNSTWGANGLRRTATESRATGKKVIVDVYVPQDASAAGTLMVGWSTGAGNTFSDFAHAVNFASAGVINVYENGTSRGTVGSGYTVGAIYRICITLNISGAATYEIQGGTQYAELGGASWTDITPGVTTSASNTLTPGATAYAGSAYISDMRVI